MIINFSNIGSAGGSGGTYVLPTATANRLGGVKIGSGITVANDGTISVSGGAGSDDVVYEYDAITAMTRQERADLFIEIVALANDNKRVWIHRIQEFDDYWFLIDTVNSNFILGFTSKNQDSLTRFRLNPDGDYTQTKQLYLPKASSSTLGGVKVGSGLTIDSNGVLSVSGGTGGDSNYVIVDALSAITNPVEGMIAFVSGHTYIKSTNCTKLQPNSNFSFEGMIARFRNANGDVISDVYMSGEQFYWDFTNDGNWHIKNIWIGGEGRDVFYLCHNDGTTGNGFIIFDNSSPLFDGTGVYVDVEEGQEANVDLDSNYDYTTTGFEQPKFYQYQGGAWEKKNIATQYFYNDMTSADTAALATDIYDKSIYSGVTDFSDYILYYTYELGGMTITIPMIYGNTDKDNNNVAFTAVVPRADARSNMLRNYEIKLYTDGRTEANYWDIEKYEASQLTVLRERQYLVCDRGTYSGYTIDLSQVPNDTVAVNYDEPSWSWLFKVQKDSEGYYRDGDGNEWSERSTYQLKERFEQRCQYYWKRTGDTMTVIFVKDAPASDSDMNFDASVSYTAITDTVDFLYTSNYWSDPSNPEQIYTGNTCSGEWSFDNQIPGIIDGGSEPQKRMPVFAFRCASGTTGMRHFAYPVAYYEDVPEVQLYDKDGSGPFTFNKRIYFDYGQYVISILGGQGEYRYAQLTIEAK